MTRKNQRFKIMALTALLAVGLSSGFNLNSNAKEQNSDSEEMARADGHSLHMSDLYARERVLSLKSVNNKSIYAYNRLPLYFNGAQSSVRSIVINSTLYIPLRQAASAIGGSYSYDSSAKTARVKASGFNLTAGSGCYTVYANDRALFSLDPVVIMSDGAMYIPIDIFAKATGMRVSRQSTSVSLTGSFRPIKSASLFYREDEVFWLGRIIEAESRGEPLLGKIAVGNVVLNRVRSTLYPNTIYGVIFDRKYGVQFSPVIDGSIYNTPSYNSILAAKIVLDGFDVSEGALFFLRPEMSSSSWIPNNRRYLFSIGKHDFYS